MASAAKSNGHATAAEMAAAIAPPACPHCAAIARRAAQREVELVRRLAEKRGDMRGLRYLFLVSVIVGAIVLSLAAAAHAQPAPRPPHEPDYFTYQHEQLMVADQELRGEIGALKAQTDANATVLAHLSTLAGAHDHELARIEGFGACFMVMLSVMQFITIRREKNEKRRP